MGPALVLLLAATFPSGQPTGSSVGRHSLTVLPGDEAALKAASLPTTPAGLLDFFRRRTAPIPAADRLADLVRLLGHADPPRRDQATAELIGYGQPAVPALRAVVNNADDHEAASRARTCLQAIEGASGAALTQSSIRLLAAQRPSGTVEVLLAYLPIAEDDQVVTQIQNALLAIGLTEGKIEESLRRALADPVPVRRAVAATVLAHIGGDAGFALVRPLLKDPRPSVRLRVAMSLVENNDADAVPILIDLLADLPPELQREAEDYLTALAGEWAITTPQGTDALSRQLRRDLWLAWWRSIDGALLLKELHQRTLPDNDRARVLALLGKLDSEKQEEREKASEELQTVGPRGIPLLRHALARATPRQKPLLAACLEVLERDALPRLPAATPRLLALRRPKETLSSLLAYVPDADNPDVIAQMEQLIGKLGFSEGRPDPLLEKALQGPVGARRAVAGMLLLHLGGPAHRQQVRKLLHDTDPEVRLRLGLELASRGEREAMPVLIALLAELPASQGWEIEEYLASLAGDSAPTTWLGPDLQARQSCSRAWAQWWQQNGQQIDLARVQRESAQGLLLVLESFNPTTRHGSVSEMDRAGKVLWKLGNLVYPVDAQVLPGQRVLVAEQSRNAVTERDLTGKVLWEQQVQGPFHVRRLPNGNTFIGASQQLVEIDSHGKQVFHYRRGNETILAAQRLRDGQVALVTYQGAYVRLDRTGKEVKSYRIPHNATTGINGGEVLSGDRVLIATYSNGKVTEYDSDGQPHWEASVPMPGALTRLANGHTLVTSAGSRIVELDRSGRIVNEIKDLPVRPWRAYRR
jgi:HEAT repeat protein